MTVTRNTLEKRVKLGAHLLDQKSKGWYEDISLPTLDMENGTSCILGQEFGDYWTGAETLRVVPKTDTTDERKAIAHGFSLKDHEDQKPTWSMLAEIWACEVARRLVKKAQRT